MSNEFLEQNRILRALNSFRSQITVLNGFKEQTAQIKRLLRNDNTGLVVPILDFHIQAATTTFKIESGNETLNEILKMWQSRLLNADVSNDIPRGLRELTTQHHLERLTSSLIVLRVKWEEHDFGGENGRWIIPAKMWIMDGCSIKPGKNTADLTKHEYILADNRPLRPTINESIIIRKPFSHWYETCPVPYLVRRGVMWNALFKQLILNKQASSMEQIIPYLLLMSAGSQKLADLGIQTTEEDLKSFKESLLQAIKEHDYTGEIGKLIAAINGDVKMEHFLPELLKLTDPKITQACDKNIMSGMGLIELKGFSSTRQEAIMNPQVFVTDVTDTVMDWASILQEVMYQMLDRNKEGHRNLANNEIRVIPGSIKTFMTDKMKSLISLAHDKGNVDTESYLEDVLSKNISDVIDRRIKEKEAGVEEILSPRQTQVLQPKDEDRPDNTDPEGTKEEEGKKPGSPEARNYKSEELTVDNIPEDIKKTLPMAARVIFAQSYNNAVKDGLENKNEVAFEAVSKKYKKNKNNKWVKI